MACTSRSLKGPRPENWATKVTEKPFHNLHKVSDSIYRSEKPDNAGFHFFPGKTDGIRSGSETSNTKILLL